MSRASPAPPTPAARRDSMRTSLGRARRLPGAKRADARAYSWRAESGERAQLGGDLELGPQLSAQRGVLLKQLLDVCLTAFPTLQALAQNVVRSLVGHRSPPALPCAIPGRNRRARAIVSVANPL